MFVIKRDGRKEEVKFDKVTERLEKLCTGLNTEYVKPVHITQKVSVGMVNNMTTSELDVLASSVAADLGVYHSDYNILSGRILASNLQKNLKRKFSESMDALYNYIHPKHKVHTPIISKETWEIVMKHSAFLDKLIKPERDMDYNIFGFETLRKSYLLKTDSEILETPQYMHMRVAIGIYGEDLDSVARMYDELSRRIYTHSSPTLFNSGTNMPQLASCFLLDVEDSIEGIYGRLKDCAIISKYAGGVGIAFQDVRPRASYIKGTNGSSTGIVPFLKNFNETCKAVNQAGKRKGSFAVYLEPHHGDILEFLDLRKNGGAEEFRTRDLYLALWMSDLFFERINNNSDWTLFDTSIAVGLSEVYGEEYRTLYEKYERENVGVLKVLKARTVWTAICNAQMESGLPYILNKDQCNLKSNQKNLGTIKNSNLCTEIVQYSDSEEIATCNLAQINLSKFVDTINDDVDYVALSECAMSVIYNLNMVIDKTFYPLEAARKSNMRHRPLGLGVSGLHDVFFMLKTKSYDCPKARELNKRIFETIYRGAILASIDLAKKHGPYETFHTSPAANGILQFDMWNVDESTLYWDDWNQIKDDIKKYGLRNSLLVALMPTATSATILGVNECFEIQTSNIYSREVIAGKFPVVNKYLIEELSDIGMWSTDIAESILGNNGSVQHIQGIPDYIKERYKTVWEYSMKSVIEMAADRSPFVDQSQSMNLYLREPTIPKLTSMFLYGWKHKLKTLSYYMHRRAVTEAVKFTIAKEETCLSCQA